MPKSLEQFDDVPPVQLAVTSRIPNGVYTLSFPDGSHKTFRIRTKKTTAKFAAGKRTIGLLIGPDNTTDYEEFGFVDDTAITVWRSRSHRPELFQYVALLWQIVAEKLEIEAHRVDVAKRCLCCNRMLTTPESIEAGIGPECASRWTQERRS